MIDTVFGIKARMSGLCINRYRPIIGHCLIGASLKSTVEQDSKAKALTAIQKLKNYTKTIQQTEINIKNNICNHTNSRQSEKNDSVDATPESG